MNTLSLIGIDKAVLKQCSIKERNGFARIATLSLINIIIATIGAYYLFSITFDSFSIAFVAGIFWAAVFANINRFVLLSISGQKLNTTVFLSIIIKLFVLSFFALLAAFPIQLLIFKHFLNNKIIDYKNEERKTISNELNLIYNAETVYLKSKIEFFQKELSDKKELINNQLMQADTTTNILLKKEINENTLVLKNELEKKKAHYQPLIEGLNNDLLTIKKRKQDEITYFETMLNKSVALIERGRILSTHKKAAFNSIMLLTILMFWYPLLFKQKAAANMRYTKLLANLQEEIVSEQYKNFTNIYTQVLKQSTGKDYQYPEEKIPKPPKYDIDNSE